MSQRIVPVKLIAGKDYVLRNGRHVQVQANQHEHCAAEFPFFVMEDLISFIYLTSEGKANSSGDYHESDVIRPVYKQGEEYLSHDGTRYCISDDSGDGLYTLYDCNAQEAWTHDGRVSHCATSIRADDLMDYAPMEGVNDNLTVPTHAIDKLTDIPLPTLPLPETPSRVGMRVMVTIGFEPAGFGVIIYEDADDTCAVEFDEGTEWIGFLHTCGGRVPSGRGWWCPNDTISVVSENESQVETESLNDIEACSNEPLTEVDVAEIWDAYRNNPSIDIDSWIAARLKLKAAIK